MKTFVIVLVLLGAVGVGSVLSFGQCSTEVEGNDIAQLADWVTTIPGSACIRGTINVVGDWDFYRFEVTAPRWVTIETITSEDTEIALLDEQGDVLTVNDDVEVGVVSSAIRQYLSMGTYYVLVHEYGDDNVIYDYTLSVYSEGCVQEVESNDSLSLSDGIGTIPGDLCATGSVDMYGDTDFYYFTVDSASIVTIYTETTGDTEIALIDDYGVRVAQNDDTPAGGLSSLLIVDLDPGMYFVEVWEHNDDGLIGQYTLHVTADFCTSEIEPNDSLLLSDYLGMLPGQLCGTGAIDVLEDVDVFEFDVAVASYVTLSTVTGGDTELALLDVYGNVLALNDDVAVGDLQSWIGATLSAGTYYAVVLEHDNDNVISTYTLYIAGD